MMKDIAIALLIAAGLSWVSPLHAAPTDEKLDKILAELEEIKQELQVIKVRVTR